MAYGNKFQNQPENWVAYTEAAFLQLAGDEDVFARNFKSKEDLLYFIVDAAYKSRLCFHCGAPSNQLRSYVEDGKYPDQKLSSAAVLYGLCENHVDSRFKEKIEKDFAAYYAELQSRAEL